FQAEDGIRDFHVTGVQTCALPISIPSVTRDRSIPFATASTSGTHRYPAYAGCSAPGVGTARRITTSNIRPIPFPLSVIVSDKLRSEERRVGKECRYRRAAYDGENE